MTLIAFKSMAALMEVVLNFLKMLACIKGCMAEFIVAFKTKIRLFLFFKLIKYLARS